MYLQEACERPFALFQDQHFDCSVSAFVLFNFDGQGVQFLRSNCSNPCGIYRMYHFRIKTGLIPAISMAYVDCDKKNSDVVFVNSYPDL